jgi:hypothetical protein
MGLIIKKQKIRSTKIKNMKMIKNTSINLSLYNVLYINANNTFTIK